MLRLSYARAALETPFNENLILSSVGCSSPVLNPLLACTSSTLTPLQSGRRNEYHAGLQQAVGRYLVIDGEYIWKYTHNGYDFSVLGNTPITFSIAWDKSKITGFALRASIPNYHGFSALIVMSSVAARFFTPQLGGSRGQSAGPQRRFPHRPRRSLQPDHAYPISAALEAKPLDRLQLALRQRTGSGPDSLIWNPARQYLPAIHSAERPAGDHDGR